MKDINMDDLNKQAKERCIEIEKKIEEEQQYLDITQKSIKPNDIIKKFKFKFKIKNSDSTEIINENLAYKECLEIVKKSKGIRCKYCGSYNIVPYYFGTLYPILVESKYLKLDKNYKYGGLEKSENSKPYYCNDCEKDFSCY